MCRQFTTFINAISLEISSPISDVASWFRATVPSALTDIAEFPYLPCLFLCNRWVRFCRSPECTQTNQIAGTGDCA